MNPKTRGDLLQSLFASAAAPLTESSAMEPGLYLSQEILDLEEQFIFEKEWLCVGRASELPAIGDYLTARICKQPIITVRGQDMAIRSISNICLHRMMRLLDGRGSCQEIVCPYHGWTYNTDGHAVMAPNMRQMTEFNVAALQLPKIRTEIWNGWIYVTLDSHASPVSGRLTDLAEAVSPYQMDRYVDVISKDYLWNANWKLVAENFMESYHLPSTHLATLGGWFNPSDNFFDKKVFKDFTYQTFTKSEDAKFGRAHVNNQTLRGKCRYTSVMPTVYPSHMYVIAPDHLWYLSLQPRGVSQTEIRFGVSLAPEVVEAQSSRDDFVAYAETFFDKVNEEDRIIVETIYQNLEATYSRPGKLSWMEREIHDFMGYLAGKLVPAHTLLSLQPERI